MEFRLAASGIRFNDYFFSQPVDLASWTPPQYAGLFCILVSDLNWAPMAFQPLYFGEFGNNSPASAILQECSRVTAAAHGKTLFASILPMPFSTTQQRWSLRNELIWAYNPACQLDDGKLQPRDLAYKLAELEKRHQEQTAQMTQLIASVNAPTEPATLPRRRIGFVG